MNQTQDLTFSIVPTSGTYTLTVDNETTGNIAFSASAVDIKAAIETAITSLNSVAVSGSYSAGFTLEITDPALTYIAPFIPNDDSLDATVTNSVTQEGVPAINFIMYYPDAQRPPLPYGTINIISNIEEGHQADEYVSEDLYNNYFWETFTVSLNIYCNDGHIARMRQLQRSLLKQTVRDTLRLTGITFRNYGAIQNISSLIDTGFEKRSQADFTFAFKATETETITEIQRVSGTTEIGDITTTFDVDES